MLNILPQDKKQRLEQESIHRLVRISAITLVMVFIVIDLIFITARYGINWWAQQLTNAPNSSSLSAEDTARVTDQIATLDKTLTAIQKLGTEQHPLPVSIVPLQNIPDGISIESINTDFTTGKVSIHGLAADRDTLLTLQELYRAYPEYAEINFPISNLTVRENIPFTAEATLVTE